MAKVKIDKLRCKACGLCIEVCPKKILIVSDKLNQKGVYPTKATDEDLCRGCLQCVLMCPDVAITVEEE